MQIALLRETDDRHVLAVRRADGTRERVALATRSFLLHDLVHLAVEAEAAIPDGFWGLLARGVTLTELSDRTGGTFLSAGLARAERIVGPTQSLWHGRLDETLYREQLPPELGPEFVDRVRARLRSLWGAWRATPFGGALLLRWPDLTDAQVLATPPPWTAAR